MEGGQSAIGICALFYIYKSAMRCDKFGEWYSRHLCSIAGGQSAMGICAYVHVIYMKIIWCKCFAEIYVLLEEGETYVTHWKIQVFSGFQVNVA